MTWKTGIDGASIVWLLGAIVGYLPAFAAVLTIIWTGIRIYETCTVQRLIHRVECELFKNKEK